jgi:hypothetical protein
MSCVLLSDLAGNDSMKSYRQSLFLAIPLMLILALAPREAQCGQKETYVKIPAAITALVFASAGYRLTTDYVAPLYSRLGFDSLVHILNVPVALVTAVTTGVTTYYIALGRIR